jgi:Neprosin
MRTQRAILPQYLPTYRISNPQLFFCRARISSIHSILLIGKKERTIMSNNDFAPANSNRSESSLAITASSTRKALTLGAFAILISTVAAQAIAQTPVRFEHFNEFLSNTQSATSNDFLSRSESKVKDSAALEEMRQAILNRYKGVEVSHSFLLDGQHYDCVPVNQQPAFRTYGLKAAAQAPPAELINARKLAADTNVQSAKSLESEQPFDALGNSTQCEANTVPLLRTTLETMSHFATLQDFYHKQPGNAVRVAQAREAVPAREFADPSVTSHKYSFTYQYVNNLGGNSNLNLWNPYVNTAAGEIFSLSQEWYIGGSGSGTQTEEVGWVVYPAMFSNSEKAHFFIFSTADDYATGCWNNSCGDFVQVADSGLLGTTWSNTSTSGGSQYEISAEYYLYQGNWWLSYNGTWIGYYPGSKYHGGQNSRYAQIIEFGTEGVGTTIWPPEGSGAFSNRGFGYSAFQRNLYYINTAGTSYWDSLTPDEPSPACYTITGPYTSTGAWTKYFYEGGPGGKGC